MKLPLFRVLYIGEIDSQKESRNKLLRKQSVCILKVLRERSSVTPIFASQKLKMVKVNLDQNEGCYNDMSVEQLLPLGSSGTHDDFGEPEIPVKVGHEFQAEIPPFVGELFQPYTGLPISVDCNHPGVRRSSLHKTFDDQQCGTGTVDPYRFTFVPKELTKVWNESESSSFLVGLYIFEKDFAQLRRFLENQEMGAILSYYYGRFYGSNEYRRWSESRKMKSKRCIYGQEIFSGLRQQELLSRLLPSVSEECRMALLEVSKTFAEGKMLLEDYLSVLKSMVGLGNLVEAIAIGKGKQDLTRMPLESSRSARPEIPTGKACSALTSSEIIMFLTGGYRLSKTRSNDLFWEAVWPRLLARGWHSEQPNDEGYGAAGSKGSLVFLVPGVKKFSRRKLAKGHDYFDSVTDVLSRVAAEPGLLELEAGAEDDGNEKKQEYDESKLDDDDDRDLPIRQRHSYLQPRTPIRGSDLLRFTVVDTSLSGGKLYKVRELKSLSLEMSALLSSQNGFEDTPDDMTDESDNASATLIDANERDNASLGITKSNGEMFPRNKDRDFHDSDHEMKAISDTSVGETKNEKGSDDEGGRERNASKSCLSRKPEQEESDSTSPMAKRRRALFPCSHAETSAGLENETSTSCSGVHGTENVSSHLNSGSSNYSPTGSGECRQNLVCPKVLIDLNIPQAPEKVVDIDVVISERSEEQHEQKVRTDDQQHDMQPRRQSTRNRPPTARALEALANGFLSVKQRKKYSRSASEMAPDEIAQKWACPHPEAAAEMVASTGPESNWNT